MKVFISYSWDSDLHKKWVLMLGNKLAENGIYVYLDQYDLKAGKNMNLFMEKAIEESDKVLLILTSNYKIKAENRAGGVGYEYSICNQKLYEKQKDNEKFIPIQRSSEFESCVPNFLKVFICHDMSNDDLFNESFIQLLRIIYDEPEIKRPALGKKPNLLKDENIPQGNKFSTMSDLLIEAFQNIENNLRYNNKPGIKVGIEDFDNLTSGFQNGSLTIIGSRPSMGKTSLAITIAARISQLQKRTVALISTEITKVQVVTRIVSYLSKIPLVRINRGALKADDWQMLERNASEIAKMPLIIDDSSFKNLDDLTLSLQKLKTEHSVEIVIIDLYQSLHFIDNSKQITKPALIRAIYNSAKELQIPIIITTKLNRSVEMRSGNKRPQFSDIPDAETIEQLADLVLLIHRPELYGIFDDEMGNPTDGMAEILVVRNRNGSIGETKLKFNEDLVVFEEYDRSNYYTDINEKDFNVNDEMPYPD